MPGKVNPVIPEVVNQIAFRLVGYDATVTLAAEAGQLELNAFEPILFDTLCEGVSQLTRGIETLTVHCVEGISVNRSQCAEALRRSVGVATALCPLIGYDAACAIAREALATRTPVEELVVRKGLLSREAAREALDPGAITGA